MKEMRIFARLLYAMLAIVALVSVAMYISAAFYYQSTGSSYPNHQTGEICKYFVHGGVVYITHFEDAAMRVLRVVSFSTLVPFVGIGTLIKAKKLRKK
jgi:hypothetical protein